MRKPALTAFALLGLASTGAMAADLTATGAIKTLDAKTCSITLGTNKTVYSFGKTCDFSKLKVGEKVIVTYTMSGKTYLASAIKAA